MNKKLFSRLLWGVLVVASFGMITSCSDYDDDISDLRNQITTTATDLRSLVDEKSSNVEKEIAALQSQQSALEDAYKAADQQLDEAIKNATNDAQGYADIQAAEAQRAAIAAAQQMVDEAVASLQAALDAANSTIDEQGKTIQSLLVADGQLQNGIDAAQARADLAYTLAEQAKTLAEGNKTQLEKVAGDLETINATLTNLQNELNVLGDKINEVKSAAEANAAKISAQETALNNLKESNQTALDALAATDTELRNLITANQTKIGELETAVGEAKAAAAQALTDAKSYTDTEIQKVKDLLDNYGTVEGVETKISTLENAYKAADKDLQDQITALDGRVAANEAAVKKINAQIGSVNATLARLMTSNVNNLITSIIFQDRYSYNVYAQVAGNNDRSNVVFDNASKKDYAYFPSKDHADKVRLQLNDYNVQAWAGYVYATVNPTAIDASKADIMLENSLQQAPADYTLGTAEVAKDHKITYKTRDAKGLSSKNGLWRLPVTNHTTLRSTDPLNPEDEAAYALYTSYQQDTLNVATNKVETVTKKVYSHYAIGLNPVQAKKAAKADLSLEGKNTDGSDVTVDAGNRILYSDLTGNMLLGTNDIRVYKKYVECIEVKNNGTVVTNGAKTFNDNNKGLLKTILDAENEGKIDTLGLVCPENYINYEIKLRYYAWNYNGSVISMERTVVFNKPLWDPDETTFSVTPDNGTSVSTLSAEFPNFPFVKGEKGRNNTLWKDEARYVEASVDANNTAMKDAVIKLMSAKQTNNTYITYETVTVGAAKKAMTVSTLANIKQMEITVNPANLKPEQKYAITLAFYNEIGALVNQVNIYYTLQIPTDVPNPWHIEAAFDSNDKLTIAWADAVEAFDNTNKHAQFAFAASFFNVNDGFTNSHGTHPYFFELTDPDNYTVGKPYASFSPSAIPSHNNYLMQVPNAALKGAVGSEHVYDMTAGIQFFGLSNLISSHTQAGWNDKFQVKFLSPIRYAILGTKGYIDGKTYEGMTVKDIKVEYSKSVDINDALFTAIDPKEATRTEVHFFNNMDHRIVETKLEFAELNSNNALFTDIKKNANGTYTLETSKMVSVVHDTPVKFRLTVTDIWGAKTEYVFPVTVIANR